MLTPSEPIPIASRLSSAETEPLVEEPHPAQGA